MEHVKTFLKTSTIHGLYYISTTRKWSKFFWKLIVIGGFSGAGYLINWSFDNWSQSPISTTVETLPISRITFPNVTDGPPKILFLNLNYDIIKAEKIRPDFLNCYFIAVIVTLEKRSYFRCFGGNM